MTSGTLISRVVPAAALGGRRARHLLERNFLVYRRAWVVVFSGFFEPLFYLFSIGIGIGELVGDVTGPTAARSRMRSMLPRLCWPRRR